MEIFRSRPGRRSTIGLRIGADLAKDRPDDALFLLKHRREQMLRLDLLVLVLFGDADGFLNGFLPANCKSVESHNSLL